MASRESDLQARLHFHSSHFLPQSQSRNHVAAQPLFHQFPVLFPFNYWHRPHVRCDPKFSSPVDWSAPVSSRTYQRVPHAAEPLQDPQSIAHELPGTGGLNAAAFPQACDAIDDPHYDDTDMALGLTDDNTDMKMQIQFNTEWIGRFCATEQRRARRHKERRAWYDAATAPVVPDNIWFQNINDKEVDADSMRARYGCHAAHILSLEADANRLFDKMGDLRQPVMWPVAI